MRWMFFLLLCACLHGQTSGIQGTAVDAVTRQPIAGVHIMMKSMSSDGSPSDDDDQYGAISRRDGSFSIANLKPGVFLLRASHNGYLYLPPRSPIGDDQVTISLKPGKPVNDLVVKMTPEAVIVGHVLDENGDPLPRAEVTAEPATKNTPRQSMWISMAGVTDDRGQFRLVLPPGKFYIRTAADHAGDQFFPGQPEIFSDGFTPPVYGPTWYPSAADKDKATVLEVTAGQNLTGVGIHLTRKRSVSVSGVVTGIPARPGFHPFVLVLLLSADAASGQFNMRRQTGAGPDGKFTFAGLVPGHYRVLSVLQSQQGPGLRSRAVDVAADGVAETGVTLALIHGESVFGTLEVVGGSQKQAQAEKTTVRLTPASNQPEYFGAGGDAMSGDVAENGTFHLDEVFPDEFRVHVMPMPDNAFIKLVKVGNSEAPDGVIDLSSGVGGAAIAITVSRDGGQLEGSLVDDDGKPLSIPLSYVALVNSPDNVDAEAFKPVPAGTKFRFTGLRPGKFRLIAITTEQFSEGFDGVRALFPKAPEIEIHERDRITKDVAVIKPEEYSGAK